MRAMIPFTVFSEIEDSMRTFWKNFNYDDYLSESENLSKRIYYPPMDIMDKGEKYLIKLDLPGMDKKDIEVKVHQGVVSISGERKENYDEKERYHRERFSGKFNRRFQLPKEVKGDAIQALFENGVLSITLPKMADQQMKLVQIN